MTKVMSVAVNGGSSACGGDDRGGGGGGDDSDGGVRSGCGEKIDANTGLRDGSVKACPQVFLRKCK